MAGTIGKPPAPETEKTCEFSHNSYIVQLMTQKTPHQILGIASHADEKEVKQAFRKLAMQYHPDRNPGDSAAEARFKEITEAYDAITKPKPAETPNTGGFGGGGSFDDFWSRAQEAFGGGTARTRPGAQQYSSQRTPPRQPAAEPKTKDWASLFGAVPRRPAPSGAATELAVRSVELTNKFNEYASLVNNAISLRKAAHDEYRKQHLGRVAVENLAVSAPEIFMAEQLFDTLTRREAAVALMDEVKELTGIAAQNPTGTEYAQAMQDVAQMDKRLSTRHAAVSNALDVMAGRSDKLRYKPRDAGNGATALKL